MVLVCVFLIFTGTVLMMLKFDFFLAHDGTADGSMSLFHQKLKFPNCSSLQIAQSLKDCTKVIKGIQ